MSGSQEQPSTRFGSQLKKIREWKQLMQKQVEVRDRSAVARYEKGDSEPGYAMIEKFAEFFKVSPEYFFLDYDVKQYVEFTNLTKEMSHALMELGPEKREFLIEMIKSYAAVKRANLPGWKKDVAL